MNKKIKKDYIIIGGGIAGLNTAIKLLDNGINGDDIIIVDKSYRLGGKIYTIYNEIKLDNIKEYNYNNYEAGAGRFTNNHINVLNYIKRYGLSKQIIELKNTTGHYLRGNRTNFNEVYKTNEKLDIKYLIEKVILETERRKYTKEYLISISFKDLCLDILDNETVMFLINAFGYNSEFENLNANDGIKVFSTDFNPMNIYYKLDKGLSQIIEHMKDELKSKGVKIILNTKLDNFSYSIKKNNNKLNNNNHKFNIKFVKSDGTILYMSSTYLILAIDKSGLCQLDALNDISYLLDSVDSDILLRIYASFPKNQNGYVWFKDIPKVTTDLPIRQFIPVDEKNGIAMISYSDSSYAREWNNMKIDGTAQLYLMKYLREMFPNILIPEPIKIDYYYWSNATHKWLVYSNSNNIRDRIIKPFNALSLYICGETYSNNQGWMEGALETSNEVVKMINKNKNSIINTKYYTFNEVSKHNKKNDAWIIIYNNVYNITNWIDKHPGGDIILSVIGKDATNQFKYYGHEQSGYATRILENYYIGILDNDK